MAKNIPSHSISGIVRYKDGTPAPGLTVKVYRSAKGKAIQEVQTDDEGLFNVSDLIFKKEDNPIIRVFEEGKRESIYKEDIAFDKKNKALYEILWVGNF